MTLNIDEKLAVTKIKPLISKNLFAFSDHESSILALFSQIEHPLTPLEISRLCILPRASVYTTLESLKKRGLVSHKKINNKSKWVSVSRKDLNEKLYEAKKIFNNYDSGTEDLEQLPRDSLVKVHRGKDSIKNVLNDIFSNNKNLSLYTLQGRGSEESWATNFDSAEVSLYNDQAKKNKIISRNILEKGVLEKALQKFGKSWAKSYIGRTSVAYEIEEEYINHSSQIWIIGNSLYLMNIYELTIIEIIDSDIVKMVKCLFNFVHDHERAVEVNGYLEKLIKETSAL